MNFKLNLILPLAMLASCALSHAQNPIIKDAFSADPSAHVFEGRVYVYPSHDIPTVNFNRGSEPWFCMSDYHVFSSEDLTHWTDHGNIVDQKDVPWGNPKANSMWAPDCTSSIIDELKAFTCSDVQVFVRVIL